MDTKNIILCLVGTLGFCVLLNAPKQKIPLILLGALISSAVYEYFYSCKGFGTFSSTLIAVITVEIYSEIIARIYRLPSTVILLPSTIPLLPGGTLYYSMIGLVNKSKNDFIYNASQTIYVAFAIAIGEVIMLIILNSIRYIKHQFTTNK